MEQEGENRVGGGGGIEENEQPQPQQPPPPAHDQLEQVRSPSPSSAMVSSITDAGDEVDQPLTGGGSGFHQQLLDMYVLDYMKKKGMHRAAEVFREESGIRNDAIPIQFDEPEGFLKQWWSIFYDTYVSRKNQETK